MSSFSKKDFDEYQPYEYKDRRRTDGGPKVSTGSGGSSSPSSSSSNNYNDMFEEVKPTITPSNFFSNLGTKFMSASNDFDQKLFSVGKNLVDGYNSILDKTGYNKLMGIDKPFLNPFDKPLNYYKDTAKDYEVDTSNASTPEKIAYWAAEQAPSFLATIPLGGAMAAGKAGKALTAMEDAVASRFANQTLGKYAGNAVNQGFQNAALDTALSTAQGGDLNQNIDAAKNGFLGGAALGTGFKAAGDVGGKLAGRYAQAFKIDNSPKAEVAPNVPNDTGTFIPKITGTQLDAAGNTVYTTHTGDTVRPIFLEKYNNMSPYYLETVKGNTLDPVKQAELQDAIDYKRSVPQDELNSPEYLNGLKEPVAAPQENIPPMDKDTEKFLNESYVQGVKDEPIPKQEYLTPQEAEKSMTKAQAQMLLDSLHQDTIKGVRFYDENAGWNGQTRSAHPILTGLREDGLKYSQIETALNNIINDKPLNPRDQATPKVLAYLKEKMLQGDTVDTRSLTDEELKLAKDNNLAENFNKIENAVNGVKPKIQEPQNLENTIVPNNNAQIPLNEARVPLETPKAKNMIDNTTMQETASTKPLSETALDQAPHEGAPTAETKNSKWKETVQESDTTSPELQNLLEKVNLKYGVKHNEDVLDFARKAIDTDEAAARNLVLGGEAPTAESNAIAQLLINKYQKSGDYDTAIDIIERTSAKATSQGQAIQALSMWGRLTPEGMLRHIQKTFDNVNKGLLEEGKITKDQLKEATTNNNGFKSGNLDNLKADKEGLRSSSMEQMTVGKKLEPLKLTPEFVQKVVKEMEEVQKMPEGYEKNFKVASLMADVDEMIPKSLARKISTIQAMAQLLNPKTAIRNIVGNGIFNGMENVSNVLSTPIDAIASLFTGKRTTTLPSLTGQAKSLKQGLKEGLKEAWKGINTSGVDGKFEIGKGGNTFKRNSVLGTAERAMGVMLQAPDRAFYKSSYDESIRQQMKFAPPEVTKPTESMKQLADYMAKYRTFQDDNELSKGMKGIKNALNGLSSYFTGTKEFGLGDLVLKYAKTPANIVARGIDYTPAGILRTVVNPQYAKKLTQKELVDQIGRSLTGTGLGVVGYGLSKLGIVTGSAPDDANQAAFEKQIGKTPYSINIDALKRYISSENPDDAQPQKGDKFTSWDWAAPTSILFGIGADIGNSTGDTTSATKIIEGMTTAMSSFLEQPVFTGVQKAFSSKDPIEGLKAIGLAAPASFAPTLGKQIAQVFDNTTRSTYDPNAVQQTINQVKAKTPIKNQELEPAINTFGQEKQNYQSQEGAGRLADIFLNPAYRNEYNPTPTTDKIENMFNASGNAGLFPDIAKKEISLDGTKIKLTPKEYTYYQQELGQKVMDMFTNSDPSTTSENVKDITGQISDIDKSIKEDIFQKRGYTKVKQGRKTMFLAP